MNKEINRNAGDVNTWDRVSSTYSENVNAITIPHARDAFQSIKKHLNKKKLTILDLGCGAGAFPVSYFEFFPNGVKGHRLVLSDISSGMIEVTKSNLSDRNFDKTETKVEYLVQDARNMEEIPDSSVDIIVSIFCVFFIPDRSKVFSEIKRMLVPCTGIFVTTAWTDHQKPLAKEFGYGIEDVIWRGTKLIKDSKESEENRGSENEPEYVLWRDSEKVKSLLGGEGLKNVRVWKSSHSIPFSGINHVWNTLRFSPMIDLSNLTDKFIEEKRLKFVKHIFPNVTDQEETIFITTASNITVAHV